MYISVQSPSRVSFLQPHELQHARLSRPSPTVYVYNIQHIPSKGSRTHLLFKCTWNTLQHRAYLGHEIRLNKFKTEIISSIFSDHNVMKLEINYKEKKNFKKRNTWRLNNMLQNNQTGHRRIKLEIKKYVDSNENRSTIIQNIWNTAKAVLKGSS